jgi:hypothetical protein
VNNPATGELLMNVPFIGGVETPHAIAVGFEVFPGMTFSSLLFFTKHALSGSKGLILEDFWSNLFCLIEIVSTISDMNCYTGLELQDNNRL